MTFTEVVERQKAFVRAMEPAIRRFVDSIPKEHLSAVLLSGSVARGDYFPGASGGMVDLTVFAKPGDPCRPEEVLGPDEDPEIPFHCARREGEWFQVWFTPLIGAEGFRALPEAKKSALLESRMLWQEKDCYTHLTAQYSELKDSDLRKLFQDRHGCAKYLASGYKVDRWKRRKEPGQLHVNLNEAIVNSVRCLYYLNGKYAPAADRLLYYSYELPLKPGGYVRLIGRLMSQQFDSMPDYFRRERLFKRRFLDFIATNAPA